MSDRKHARYAPSKLNRIIRCPGSVKMSELVPEPPGSKYAAEGTLLHEYASEAVRCELEMPEGKQLLEAYYRKNNVSTQHKRLIGSCIDVIRDRVLNGERISRIFREKKVSILGDDCYGTLDLAIETPTKVHIIDFKFGAGVEVDAEDNEQLLAYTLGLLFDTGIESRKEVWNWILQPKRDKYEGVPVPSADLIKFKKRLKRVMDIAKGTNPPIIPGEEQCRWCPAGTICAPRVERTRVQAEEVFKSFADLHEPLPVKEDARIVRVEKLADILRMESQITSAFKAIREYLFGLAMSGSPVPGYKVALGRGSRKWLPGLDIEDLHQAFPDLDTEDMLNVEMKSVPQIEEMLSREEKNELKKFYTKEDGRPVLVPEESEKQAVGGHKDIAEADAQKAFSSFADDLSP